MGSHGHGYVKGALLGNNTQSVMRQAKVPLLIKQFRRVEGKGKEDLTFVSGSLFGKVLYPTDFSPNSQRALEAVIEQFQKDMTQEVVVVHIQDTRVLVLLICRKRWPSSQPDRYGAPLRNQGPAHCSRIPGQDDLENGYPLPGHQCHRRGGKRLLDRAGLAGKSNVREAYTGSETEFITLQHVTARAGDPKGIGSRKE